MIVNYDFDIEESKDGCKILKIHKDNRKIYIGSKYRMKESLDKFINEEKKDINEESILIIFGIGTGQYIRSIYNKFKDIKIIIFEPNSKLIEYIKDNRQDSEFLNNKNVYLLNAKNEKEVYEALKLIIGEFDVSKIIYKSIPNYEKIYEQQILKFNKIVKTFLNDVVICRNTCMYFHKRWFDTLISNLKYMITGYPIESFRNKYKNIPAIIVSAGPSLNKNINELKNISNDMLILTGGRTLRTLYERNINPNLIGVVDPGEASYKLVKGYIEKTQVPLLFYEGSNEVVVEKHKGKKIFFSKNYMMSTIFDMYIENLGVGGSIAHTLTSAAIVMGCNPIIFIGQDLAYTGEKYHADIAINQFINPKENEVEECFKGIYVEDINGDKVRTNEVLDNFRRDLEKIIGNNKDITFINATEGGAKINGTVKMTLKDAIKKYKIENNIRYFEENDKLDRKKIKQRTIESLERIIEADEKIINEAKRALRIIKDLEIYIVTKQKSKVDKCLKELDNIDEVIKEKYENLHILRSIIYPVIYNILSNKKPKNDKEIIQRNKYLYESILNVSKEVLYPIKKVKCDIEKMENLYD